MLNIESQGDTLNEDDLFSSRQTIKHTCLALKRYFEMHLAIKVDSIKRSYSRDQGVTPPEPIPKYKVSVVVSKVDQSVWGYSNSEFVTPKWANLIISFSIKANVWQPWFIYTFWTFCVVLFCFWFLFCFVLFDKLLWNLKVLMILL